MVVEFLTLCTQASLDVSETLPIRQLFRCQAEKLIQGG